MPRAHTAVWPVQRGHDPNSRVQHEKGHERQRHHQGMALFAAVLVRPETFLIIDVVRK